MSSGRSEMPTSTQAPWSTREWFTINIGLRARGGGWRHAMARTCGNSNFLPGHRLPRVTFYGRPYNTKWDKLNLGACIQQADTRCVGTRHA